MKSESGQSGRRQLLLWKSSTPFSVSLNSECAPCHLAREAEGKLVIANHEPLRNTGVVRSPALTTVMQVSSRFLLVWGIVHPYPFVSAAPTYSSMLIAWSVTEVIRYSFFATAILGMCPGVLLWLRYNTFFILYPVGIFSEVSLIWLTTKIGGLESMIRIALYAILVIYVPGKPIIYMTLGSVLVSNPFNFQVLIFSTHT